MSDTAGRYRDFLRLLWQNGLLQRSGLTLSDGTSIEIVHPGTASASSVDIPDFSHAAIRYCDIELTLHGSIRIDYRSSDWRAAGTISNAAFDSVILHVVAERDHILVRGERPVPTLVLRPRAELSDLYFSLIEGRKGRSCVEFFTALDSLYQNQIISRVISDRMNRKSAEILEILNSVKGDWQETTYIAFMKAFGYKERKIAFERLARSMPYRHLRLHSDNPLSVEAMLLGQAGYLEMQNPDEYTRNLQDEYISLRRRYNLLQSPLRWRVEPQRPASTPAQLLVRIAHILSREESLMERVLMAKDIYELISIFDIILPEYWQHHYIPSHPASAATISYGTTARQIDLLMINFVIPLWVAYGIHTSNEELREKALDLYESIRPEENSITRRWSSRGFCVASAMVSQAMIQITVEYCETGQCALCPIGAEQLRRSYKKYNL